MDFFRGFSLPLCLLLVPLLAACGGGGGSGNSGGTPVDTSAPSTPSMSIAAVTALNYMSHSFTPGSAEIGTDYFYSYTDQNSLTVEGSGSVSTSNFTVSNIDLTRLADGPITFELYLVDDAGNQSTSIIVMLDKNRNIPANTVLSGKITFEYVPHNIATDGLDYNNSFSKSARGIEVLLLDKSDTELASTVTDNNGMYSFTVTSQTQVKIRAKARLVQAATASWDFSVTDNTNNDALYVLDGSLSDTGITNRTRNLHAESGWGGSGYTETRAAAPFAILDTIFSAIQLMVVADPLVSLPTSLIHWSVLNNTAEGNVADGDLGSSFYSQGDIYLLGAADNDTDEYDEHVIAHEWTHYFEDQLSRSDGFGGDHTGGDFLDMRVAFSEGLGNAFSAMIVGDAVYRDSVGDEQSFGFRHDIEDNNVSNKGWYSELSVQAIIYDIYDANDDNGEFISTGMGPIYSMLTSNSYKNAEQLIGIHAFLAYFKQQFSNFSSEIDDLADDQDIVLIDAYGTGETNDGGLASTLPIYKSVSVGGAAVEVCSTDIFGTYNKLSNAELVRFSIHSAGSYTFTVTRSSGLVNSDPDFRILLNGQLIASGVSATINSEQLTQSLTPENYILEVEEYGNIVDINSGDVCFDVEIN